MVLDLREVVHIVLLVLQLYDLSKVGGLVYLSIIFRNNLGGERNATIKSRFIHSYV